MNTAVTTAATERVGALDRLRALNGDGLLAADYPAVPALLAEINQSPTALADLARAGRLLARLDPDRIRELHPGAVPMTAAVTGHGTLDALTAPLTAQLARHGIPLRTLPADYDSWARDLRDTTSPLYAKDTDLALCVLDAQVVFDELPLPFGVEDVVRVTTAKLDLVDRLAGQYMEHGSGTLVLNTVPLLHTHTHRLVDHRSRAELSIAWREFNTGLLRLQLKYPRVHTVDTEPLIAEGGPVRDARLAAYAKVHLGEDLLARYAREVGHLARSVRGRTKKVLVVDLDNTLWDGILGDDGPDGIAAASTYRGEAFHAFQKAVKQIGSQGVLLAVCSKNDRDPVLDVLRGHPDMVLRDTDFVRVNANWQPKDANLRDIAARLNLGTDSFVFADDSPFECGLVASSLPEVAVVRLDEEPAAHIEKLLADGWFDTRELTATDRNRTEQYRTEAERQDLLDGAGSMEEYLRELGVRVDVSPPAAHELPRVAQLTMRTNQFNLTTQRLQLADVQWQMASPDHMVLAVRSRDRFGENGLVGVLFGRRAADGWHLDNMLLSCRVFARGIEQAAVASVLAHVKAAGEGPVHAGYAPTAKNAKVRDFWPSLGFATTSRCEDGVLGFTHDLAELPEIPGHLTLDVSFGPTSG
ncbi:HAD-IIIC family phosphatase [Streptomyces sp. NPDC050560]|uniref:HAD-IIIC family phosphatase n=1 Tax=Streptomyces sp. NPDC050560 TaxID=3365630 RepID=UPI0037A12117